MAKRQNKPGEKSSSLQPVLYSGSAGWTIPSESSAAFPAGGTHLERYSRVLNSAEINSSFYRPHKPQTWKRWRESVPDTFLFSVKAPKAITHEAKLSCRRDELLDFFAQLKPLKGKLGPVLFQLPPSLSFVGAAAEEFFSMLRAVYGGDIVLEPRHSSWFEDVPEDMLRCFRVARVAADPACVPAASQPGGWGELRYYRLHGSPRRFYSAYESVFLRDIVSKAAQSDARDVWCIFDNTASGAAIKNALEMRSLWRS